MKRRANGHRAFGQEDLNKLRLISCLKKTGMPLEDMKPYLNVSPETGLEEFPKLLDMMRKHRDRIQSQIESLQQVLDFIDAKMEEGMQVNRDCTV